MRKRDQLGRMILRAPEPTFNAWFIDELVRICAVLLRHSRGRRLVFVGRSAENLFDLLSGLLDHTEWRGRLILLPFSLRSDASSVRRIDPRATTGLRQTFHALTLGPDDLALRTSGAAFIDVVESGQTMTSLAEFLRLWSTESGSDWRAVQRNIHALGLVRGEELDRRPHRRQWASNETWTRQVPIDAIGISIARAAWWHLAESAKTTLSHVAERWSEPARADHLHKQECWTAARHALWLRDVGATQERRTQLASLLIRGSSQRISWLRGLTSALVRS